jgi:hypothetical protein
MLRQRHRPAAAAAAVAVAVASYLQCRVLVGRQLAPSTEDQPAADLVYCCDGAGRQIDSAYISEHSQGTCRTGRRNREGLP